MRAFQPRGRAELDSPGRPNGQVVAIRMMDARNPETDGTTVIQPNDFRRQITLFSGIDARLALAYLVVTRLPRHNN